MRRSPPLSERLGDPTSILVLAPIREEPDNHACMDLLTPTDPHDENVLSITVSATPDERLALWKRHVGKTLPKRAAIVDAGSPAVTDDQLAASDAHPSITVDILSDRPNPHELSAAVGQYLGAWEPSPERTLVCLHSLTSLLEIHDRSTVFQLLSALNTRFARADVSAHYHLDPNAHDDQVIAELRPLFDTVVEHDADGAWTVQTTAADEAPPRYHADRSPDEAPSCSATESPVVDQPPLPYSFDTVIELLSERLRRYVLYDLVDQQGACLSLETVVDRVHERASSGRTDEPSRIEIKTRLVHSHLPRLEEAGIVTFDADDETITYHTNSALEPCLKHARTIEQQ